MDQLDLFKDYFEEESISTEDEADFKRILESDLASSIVQATDWTTDTIIDQISKGRILLTPKFQRRDAWTIDRKSAFIESLLLGFPIPQIVLAEMKGSRGKFVVIDGKQRLLSIIQFAGQVKTTNDFDRLKLRGMTILEHLNGMSFNDIAIRPDTAAVLDEFHNRTIRTVVIRHWQTDVILYHIFLRLNTGSVQLSPQELRNALLPGPFADFIDDYSGCSIALRSILKTDKPDFRMRDAEILLRYYALRNFLTHYSGSIKEFLDLTTQSLNKSWQTEQDKILQQARDFEMAVTGAFEIFGESSAFRKWKSGQFIGRFNRAVFDIMVYYLCNDELNQKLRSQAELVKKAFIDLCEKDLDFLNSIETTTKSLEAVATRFGKWTEHLNAAIGTSLPVPRLEDNRIVLG